MSKLALPMKIVELFNLNAILYTVYFSCITEDNRARILVDEQAECTID